MQTPEIFQVLSNIQETKDIFTLTLSRGKPFQFLPGQFNMLSVFGNGEVPISISSDLAKPQDLVHTIRAVGPVTNALQKLQKGDEIGVRGPFGSCWPLDKKNKDILIVSGGTGLCPLRAALCQLAFRRKDYNHVTVLYGTRTPQDIMYRSDIPPWKKLGLDVVISVDQSDSKWTGPVGVVTPLIGKHVYDPANTIVMICGPEVMIRFAIQELTKTKVPEDQIYLSLERNMQCGVGFCGHCQFGPYFICKDGPVFSYSKVKKWLAIKEL